jgi:exopolysaccharide production protein ExoQ
MFPSTPIDAARRISVSLELGLDATGLLFLPVLVLVPHGIAPLVSIAGMFAIGLVLPNGIAAFQAVRVPALLLGALLVWASVSAGWSVDPVHSLLIAARLVGLFAAGLMLAAAANAMVNPRRLLLCFYTGLAVALILALIQFETNGLLTRTLQTRGFFAPQLNQAADTLAILALPASAALVQRGRAILGVLLAALILAVIIHLVGTAAKAAIGAGLVVAPLLYFAPRVTARTAAVVCVLMVITAPLTFARVARLEAVTETAEGVKFSAWHRLMIWSFAGDRIAERPLVGWGLDASRAIPGGDEPIYEGRVWLPLHPHNAAIQLWLELGVPGAVLFGLLLAWLWLGLATTPWPRLFAAAAGAGLTSAVIAAIGAYGIWQEWWIGTLGLSLFVILVMRRYISDLDLRTIGVQRRARAAFGERNYRLTR